MSALPPIVAVLTADLAGFSRGMATAKGEMQSVEGVGGKAFAGLQGVGRLAMLGLAGAAVGGGIAALKMGADFETSMTQLVTGAGEAKSNMDLVSKGILSMAGDVGTSAMDLAKGMYMVESAGFHGAEGLSVLRAAAEGAKVGQADMATVADGLTTALNAYHMPASAAAKVTSELIATVAAGKMHVQDLSSSLGAILPIASALNVPFEQITGAMATMTSQGTDAATSSQSLRFLLAALAGPTAAAAKELKALGVGAAEIPGMTAAASAEIKKLGLHTSDVAATLAKGGLPAAMKLITDSLGKEFPVGSAQYEAGLKAAVGGTRGLTAALELTGGNAATWAGNIKTISGATTEAGGHVRGWSDVQKDFNQQMAKTVEATKAVAIQIGLVLIPYAEKAMVAIVGLAGWLKQHKDVSIALAGAIGGVLLVAIAAYTVSMISAAVATVAATWPILAVVAAVALLVGGVIYAYNHVDWFRNTVNFLWKEIQILWGWMSQYLIPVLGTLAGVIVGIVAPALGVMGGLVTGFQNIGRDAINGLVQGLRDGWWKINDVIHTLAMLLPQPLKDALGIHSPSSVFADQIGKPISEGIAIGITAGAPKAYGAVSGLVKGLVGGVPSSGLGAAGSLSGGMAAAGGGAGGINVYLTVQGNVFNSTETANQLADAIRAALLQRKRSTGNLGLA